VYFGLILPVSLENGYLAILLFTWIQNRSPKGVLGRMMGLVMFSIAGLVLISQAASGAISKWDLDFLFVSAGVLVSVVISVFQPRFKEFSESMFVINHSETQIPSEALDEHP
jgi:hypothetical protein